MCQLNEIFCVDLLGQNCEFLFSKVFFVSCLFIVKFFKIAKTRFEKCGNDSAERIFDFKGLNWRARTALSYAKTISPGIEKKNVWSQKCKIFLSNRKFFFQISIFRQNATNKRCSERKIFITKVPSKLHFGEIFFSAPCTSQISKKRLAAFFRFLQLLIFLAKYY